MSLLALVGCTVDLERRTIRSAGGVTGRLGAADARLLAFLAERPLETIDRDTLAAAAWPARSVSARAVDGAVRRLRAALGTAAHQLATVHGDGYRFVPADRPPTVTPTTPIPSRERPTRTPIPVSTGSLDLVQGTFDPFGGEPVPLTGTEARVMEVLADHLGQAVDRRHIARAVWGRGDHARALEKVVAGLRAKLGAGAIHTIRGAGIRLEPVGDDGTFVDRPEAQVAAAALRDHRWVTLVGTGGIGKTRLAAELARRWLRDHPHAVVQTCALAHVGTEGSFLAAVAAALGLDPTGDPANRIGPALARLPPDALVVLDTFEQLLGCRPWLEAWLSAAPVRFLVTSRERLGGRDERWVVLAPLDPARSAALYRAYAPGDHADPDVAAVVARLDGLPLAIELAAARADQIPPREMAARLARPLDLLVRRSPTAYSGHSTLRGAFDGSWDLLSPPERQVWTGCAVFASPWTAADAAAVTGVADAEPHLVRLAARSLMIRDHERWSMLDTLRGYADEKRVLGGGDALDRHAAVFAALADNPSGQAGYGGPGMDRIRSALPELVAVVHRASDPRHRGAALRAIVMHGWYDHTLARIRDAVAGVGTRGVDPPNEAVLDAARALIEPERADAWLTAAAAAAVDPGARRLVDGITAYRLFQRGEVAEAAAVAQALLDPTSLRTLAESGSEYAQYAVQLAPDGAAAVERARGHAERLGDPRVLASVLRERSVAASLAGSFDDAISFADRAIAAAASAGWAFGRAGGLAERIGAEVRSGRLLAALQSLAELERLDVEPGAEPRLVGLLWGAGVSAELGDLDGARARFDSAEVRGDLDPQWRIGRAYVERLAGRPALALDGLGGATAWSIAGGSAWACAAGAAAELGRLDQADAWLAQALSAPHADRFAATAHLVAVARARLDGDLAAAERAARAFVDRQPLVTCDDGRLRVRPMLASFQHELLRALLDRAGR